MSKPKQRTTLVPRYMKQFACLGSNCEDTCCVGWNVQIDRDTYKKYNKLRDPELSPLFDQHIVRNRQNPSDEQYAWIKMDGCGRCPFLTEEHLCGVQLKLGGDMLSDACMTWPRVTNLVNGVTETSATLGCPEAARLALLNPDGIDFEEILEPVDNRVLVSKQVDPDKFPLSNARRYFWELRVFTIQVLQNRSLTLSERLIFLGLFYQNAQKRVEEGQAERIPGTITTFTALMDDPATRQGLANIPSQVAIQMELLKELVDKRASLGITHQPYIECVTEFIYGVHYDADSTVDQIAARYQDALITHYKPFMDDHEYILENYLVNHVFKNLVPFDREGDFFKSYNQMVLQYALIKMHLIGMSGFHKGLTKELVIKLIYGFGRAVEHHGDYLKRSYDLLERNGYNTMAAMAILIKH